MIVELLGITKIDFPKYFSFISEATQVNVAKILSQDELKYSEVGAWHKLGNPGQHAVFGVHCTNESLYEIGRMRFMPERVVTVRGNTVTLLYVYRVEKWIDFITNTTKRKNTLEVKEIGTAVYTKLALGAPELFLDYRATFNPDKTITLERI